ncbi:MAG: hypothetical protein R3F61_18540 [Myxococcota bacterium]
MPALVLWLALSGCKKDGTVVTDTDTDTGSPTEPSGLGGPCADNAGCAGELVCSSALVCANAGSYGTTAFGEECFGTVECEAGLVCDNAQTCTSPGGPGTTGRDGTCASTSDCQSPLSCYADTCTGFEIPRWDGASCTESDPPWRVHFEVPRGPLGSEDFFRLPFPNDVRVTGTSADLDGFPSSSLTLVDSSDVSAAIAGAYGTAFPGFGPNQAVFLRTSDYPTFDTVLVGLPGEGASSVALVDITEGTPQYGVRHPTGWKIANGRPYLCDPWIALYPSIGRPFLPGHTYAAVIGTTLLGPSQELPVQDPDFAAMLGGPPADTALMAAWTDYQPFRDWLASSGTQGSSIAGAAVFTVMDPAASATRIRDVVRGSSAPTSAAVVECAGLPGPHADPLDPTRGCFTESTEFHEIQGTLAIPHVQQGSAPFKTIDDGGAADWATGQPVLRANVDVTFAATVPRGTPPVDGWPVVLFAHDHAGNYRSFIEDGLASELTNVVLGDGTNVGFVVVSIDTWMTNGRRGTLDPAWVAADPAAFEPTVLYTSPLNPLAARDNITQSAVDWFQVVRFLEAVDWSAVASPTGEDIPLDLTRVYFVGHGIGASAGPLVLAREDAVQAGVFAAAGAFWTSQISDTQAPVQLRSYVAAALGDPEIDRFQPVLSMAQGIVDRTDPLNQARYVHLDATSADKHVLQVLTRDDPWMPEDSQYALARGLYTQQVVQSGLLPLSAIDEVSPPVSSNVGPATAVTVLNDGADPHRLLFDDARTKVQVREFLASAVRDGTPTVPSVP